MNREHVIKGLLKYARPLILKDFAPNSCIASTRVAVEVLRYFDIPARPLAVSVMIFNEKAWTHLPEIDAGKVMADFNDGSWSLGINNHLVAVAGYDLIDLSLDQANRKGREGMMGFTPAKLNIPHHIQQSFLVGRIPIQFTRSNDKTTVSFLARPTDIHYRTSPDWKIEKRWKPIVGAVVRLIRDLPNQVRRHATGRHEP